MATVLIIDAQSMLRDYVKEKLSAEKIEVEVATNRDAIAKALSLTPDLIIVNFEKATNEEDIIPQNIKDFFQKKITDPNLKRVPIIVTGPELPRENITKLVQFGMIKYFKTPIKFDVFFEAIGKRLNTILTIDSTPCVLDLHANNNIIFIEVAMGLNREKISLLKYKITELIDKNDLSKPKVILMMTSLSLSFVDGMNIELLLDNILADTRIKNKSVKILTLDSIVPELIEGHPEYEGIEVSKDLSSILTSLVDKKTDGMDKGNVADVISTNILESSDDLTEAETSMGMRFSSDSDEGLEELEEEGSTISVAVIDDDKVTLALIKKAFSGIGAKTDTYENGKIFIESILQNPDKRYDIIILDLIMNELNGFEVLLKMRENTITTPVIVYSQAIKKEVIVKALSLGAKSYLLKPQRPEAIVQKSMDILNNRAES